jgi:hypothetical protein
MVAMEVADKDVVYLCESDMVLSHLQLGSLAAVDQKKPLMSSKHMSGWVSF